MFWLFQIKKRMQRSSLWKAAIWYFTKVVFLLKIFFYSFWWASQVALVVKNPPANAGYVRDMGLIPESGRSPGKGNGNPLWDSCLENPMDRGVWHAISMGSQKVPCGFDPWVGHNWVSEHTFFLMGHTSTVLKNQKCIIKYEIRSGSHTSVPHLPSLFLQTKQGLVCSLHRKPNSDSKYLLWVQFSSVQSLSHVWLFATPWTAAHQASLSVTNPWCPPKPMSIESVIPFNHLILCRPLLLLPLIFLSIRVFSNESALHIRWPKYWSFSFNISPSNEYPGLISFMMDWLDLLAVQGTLKSLLQYHSSKASIFQRSAFFIVQLSHPYMTTGKIIALTKRTFVDKVMSLLFNMLSRLVITFLPRSKHLLISWLQSPSAVILEHPPNKVWHCFHCFPIYFPWSDGTGCHDLRFLNVEL